MTASVV